MKERARWVHVSPLRPLGLVVAGILERAEASREGHARGRRRWRGVRCCRTSSERLRGQLENLKAMLAIDIAGGELVVVVIVVKVEDEG